MASNGFEITRCRQDQQTKNAGCSVFLRFSLIGPPGVHPIVAQVDDFSGSCPELSYDRLVDIEPGATGYVNVTLEFDKNPLDACTLSLSVCGAPLSSFMVRPPGCRQPAA